MQIQVGVISDTHDHLNPKIFDRFKRVERILHAGDIGSLDIVIELSAIAPVIAVSGNMDTPPITQRYPIDQRIQVAGADIFMTHNGGMLLRNQREFRKRCGDKRPDVFVWGHTHRAEVRDVDGMLSVNPGSASRPMFDLPASVAILTLEPGKSPRADIVLVE
ncbi:MAG: metallophosphoesterase [Candidatus Abyssubacteria bacterium]